MIDRIRQDVRYTLRTYVRSPGFALLAVLTMAIGIGANTAIFSVVNTVLLRPLPFADPDRLFLVSQVDRKSRQGAGDATPANFLDWRERSRAFTAMAAFRDEPYVLSSGDRPERVGGGMVNANFFDVLGVAPALGRRFEAGDEAPGAPRVVIMSDGLWKRRFGGRGDVIGQSIRLNGEPHTIVGIMPPGIDYPDHAALWTPPHWRVPDDPLAPAVDAAAQRDHGYLFVIARTKPNVTVPQAQADMDAVALGLERDYPDSNTDVAIALVSLRDNLVGDVRPTILLLFAAVGVLLLIATVNVAGLLVARATSRHQEIAVRMALGASRGRVAVQLLTESALLGIVGGGCGVLLSMWMLAPFVVISPRELGVTGDVQLDPTVMVFALAVSALSGLAFGMLPVRQLMDRRLHDDLRAAGRGVAGAHQRRLRGGLVVAQIALSLVLLVGAGLTIKSFVRLQRVPTGFDADGVIVTSVNLPAVRYATTAQRSGFWERALEAARSIDGVDAAAVGSRLPLSGGNSGRGLLIDGRNPTPPVVADYRTVSADYFRVLRIPLLRGRPLADDDRAARPLVAVVSASMAAAYWPSVDPIGHTIAIDPGTPITIVGVVGDVRHAALESAPRPTFYVPYHQDPWSTMTLALRTAASPAAVTRSVQRAIAEVDRDQPVGAVRTLDDFVYRSLARRRFGVTLLATFGTIAVVLAAVGLYGVLAFIVGERRREIGVRMALGAQPRAIVADLLGQGLRLTGLGVGIGAVLALAATRLLNALLFGTSPTDAATFAAAAALIVTIAAAASVVPALRASRVDPLVALRDE
jgi:putative ABC transport system permease protein